MAAGNKEHEDGDGNSAVTSPPTTGQSDKITADKAVTKMEIGSCRLKSADLCLAAEKDWNGGSLFRTLQKWRHPKNNN